MIQIKEVRSRKDLKEFIDFPFRLYSKNPNWIPPMRFDEMNTLDRERNPAFEFCEARYWIAYKDGEIAGRIAGIINRRYLERWDKKRIRFSWIDFIEDGDVAGKLLETVEAWGREKGFDEIHGPLGFCDLDKEGMLVEGFEEKGTFITIYNYPYYPEYLEKLGYVKDVDWVEYDIRVPGEIPERIGRLAKEIAGRYRLKILEATKPKHFLPYVKDIFGLLNEAYRNLYAVVPLSERQIEAYKKQYFGFINPDYVKVVLDENNSVAAFGIALPSLSDAMKRTGGKLFPLGFIHVLDAMKHCKTLDLYLVAVRPDLQNKGITALLMNEVAKSCIRNGVVNAIASPQLEYNDKVQSLWKFYDARICRRRRCFIKQL